MAEKEIKKRSQTDKKYHWRIEDLYHDTESWQKDFDRVKIMSQELSAYEGTLTKSAKILLEFLEKKDQTGKLLEAIYVYANQKYHEDTSVSEFQRLSDLAAGLMSHYSSAISFVEPELLELSEELLEAFEKEEQGLQKYHRFFQEIFRHREHTCSKEIETLLAQTTELAETASNIFSMFNNADITFPEIEDEDGQLCRITHARYMNFMQSSNRRVRKDAFLGLYHIYQKFKNTLGATFIGNLKKDAFYAKIRKYSSSLAMALDDANIPEVVYHTLIQTVHNHMDAMYQYLSLRKEVLHVEELHFYDIYVPMMPDFKKTHRWSYQLCGIFFLACLVVNDYIGHFPTFKVAAFGMIPLFLTVVGLIVYGFWKGCKCSVTWGRRKMIRLEVETSIIIAVTAAFSELYLLGIAVWAVSMVLFAVLLKKYGSHNTSPDKA